MDTIAVVIRGHLRTWNFCKESMFTTFESQYPDVDWYFVTWRESLTEARLQSLKKDFQGRKLHLYIIEEHSKSYNPWHGPGVLCMQVAEEILQKEYHTVFETRPDVHLYTTTPFPEIQPNSFYTTAYNMNQGAVWHAGSADWFTASDAKVFHTYAWNRLHGTNHAPHQGYVLLAQKHNINLMNLRIPCKGFVLPSYRPADISLIRPSIFIPDTGGIGIHGTTWMGWDREKKIQVLKDHDIALDDYDTGGCAAIDVEYGQ